jgi:hypothetical protein
MSAKHGDLCGGGLGHDLFRRHVLLDKPEVGMLLVCASRFGRQKIGDAKFRPVGSDKVYLVSPPSAAMEIINAKDPDEALATLRYWAQGLP